MSGFYKGKEADLEAQAVRKAEIEFMQKNESDFTKTPILKCYYETTPHFDSILTDISKLRYDVDRSDNEKYQMQLDHLQFHLMSISLAIKNLVMEERAKEENG